MPPKRGVKTGPTHYLVVKAVRKNRSWAFKKEIVPTAEVERVIKETRKEQQEALKRN
ncbi:MAG: hypothetical protein GXO48_03775 [Chlorobi bacterium]|nr:hypothetical protein [Chlorobiota bacterium]